jgi:tetratricopeptide (TPR) repeat protein
MAPDVSERGRRLAPILFSLAILNRPDAVIFAAGWFAARALGVLSPRGMPHQRGVDGARRDGARGMARDLAIMTALLAPFFAWKIFYYGDALPNTYYAKGGFSLPYLARGLEEAGAHLRVFGAWGVMPMLAALSTLHPVHGRTLGLLAAILALGCVYVVAVGGDVLPLFRLWLPVIPLGSALVSIGTVEAMRLILRRATQHRAAAAAATVLLAWTALNFVMNHSWIREQRRLYLNGARSGKAMALWLREHVAPSEAIAATAVGQVAYESERRVIDMLGLTDSEIARRPRFVDGLTDTWKEKKYNAESVLRRRPRAIIFSTGARPSSNSEKALFLYEDFHRSYFPREIHLHPKIALTGTVFWLRDDAPAPGEMTPTDRHEFLRHYSQALLLHGKRETQRAAIAEFEDAAMSAPPFATCALEWWSVLRYEMGDSAAFPILREVVRRNPYATRGKSRLAHHLTNAGELEEAETLLQSLVEANPDDAEGWEGLAKIEQRRGNAEKALGHVRKSLELWSTNLSALELFGEIAISLERWREAESAYVAALELQPESEGARRGLAHARNQLKVE